MSHLFRFRASVYSADLRQPAHQHDRLQISLVLRGALQETVHGNVATAGALSVVVKDAGVRHADHFGQRGATIAQLSVPSNGLQSLIGSSEHGPAWYWSHGSDVARPFLRIVLRAADGETRFATDDDDIIDLLATISTRRAAETRGTPPRWLADAVDELRCTWRAGTRVSEVAARVGVHPVYLARCFRRWYGRGVSDELRALRERTAADAIATDTAMLSTIAHEAGYADEPHLNRDFRALSGLSPGRFRRALRRLTVRTGASNEVARIQA